MQTMLIYLLAFVGGIFTILSPCILPVLPFVFAHADRPFRRAAPGQAGGDVDAIPDEYTIEGLLAILGAVTA